MPTLKAVLGALAAALIATPALARPPLWVVRDKDSELVLFGSIHALPATLDWRPPELDAAMKRSDDLWFEFPSSTAAEVELAKKSAAAAQLPVGQSLSKLLPRADAERLGRLIARFRLDRSYVERLKPWMAEVYLTQTVLARTAGAYGDYSVEAAVQAGTPGNVPRYAFQTSAQQLQLFQDPPLAQQVAGLGRAMATLERDPAAYRRVVDAWMSGDVARLQRVAVDPERRADPEGFRRMVTDRNAAWTTALDRRLKGKGRTLVIVGVGHLVGADGLPARLRALGYSVTGP